MACNPSPQVPKIDKDYLAGFDEHLRARQQERDYYLKLCGLVKLPELTSVIGTDSLAEIQVGIEGLPPRIGVFSNDGDQITFVADPTVEVLDKEGNEIDQIVLSKDTYGNSERMYHGRLSWMLITRGGAPYVRMWDEQNPAVEAFEPFDRYKLTDEFIFVADFQYYDEPKKQIVTTQLGPPETTEMVGSITFNYQGKDYTLDVGSGGFTMLADATTGVTTYGGGRYIDLILPDQSGPMILDFNKLYNPPCTFSEYTTCQYPPEQNVLPFEIKASELYKGH